MPTYRRYMQMQHTEVIKMANTFQACQVVFRDGNNYQLAIASNLAILDFWIILKATPDSFDLPLVFGIFDCPNHGKGANGDILYLSNTVLGELTNIRPNPGQRIKRIGTVVDANRILWRPEITVSTAQ